MRRDAAFTALELNAVRLVGRERAARLGEPDLEHTSTIGTTARPCQASRNVMISGSCANFVVVVTRGEG